VGVDAESITLHQVRPLKLVVDISASVLSLGDASALRNTAAGRRAQAEPLTRRSSCEAGKAVPAWAARLD
jgi:hypothetical protein